MVAILMMSAKMATLGLLKIKMFLSMMSPIRYYQVTHII